MGRAVRASGFVGTLTLGCAMLSGNAARAEAEPCFDAAVAGQKLQRDGQLLRARAEFAACASARCPATVSDRCAKWLAAVNEQLPSLVLAAQDARGRDVTDARVTLDGAELPGALGGKAIEVDPGNHRLRFERAGAAAIEQQVVVRQHEKGRQVSVIFRDAPAAEAPAAKAGIPPLTYVFGAAGAVALGVGVYLGITGVVNRGNFGCDGPPGCGKDDAGQVRTELVGADIAFGTSLVTIAIATGIWLAARSSHRPLTTGPQAAPNPGLLRSPTSAVSLTTIRF